VGNRLIAADGIHSTAPRILWPNEGPPLALVALDLGWWRDRDDELIVRRGILSVGSFFTTPG